MTHIPALLLEVMQLLGVDLATARTLLAASPAVLLGGISITTVDALRARFTALGPTSTPAARRTPASICSSATARRRSATARSIDCAPPSVRWQSPLHGPGPLVVPGLNVAAAGRVWHEAAAM